MRPRVLIAMPAPRRLGLLGILERSGMKTDTADNFRDGRKLLQEHSYDLLFVDAELPGSPWHSLLETILSSAKRCDVVVCSRCGDERLWADVLQRGAYDLLPEPFVESEVIRIANRALESHYLERYGSASRQSIS